MALGEQLVQQALNRIRQIKQDLINNREAEVLTIALDQIALIKLRIQTKGQNSNEQPFAPYTEAYAKERKGSGYQVGYVDFTRTGRMFAAIRPRIVQSSPFSATVQIEGADQRAKDIVAGAVRKRGDITRPSSGEIAITKQANDQRVFKHFKKR